jgi:hypothetical protein
MFNLAAAAAVAAAEAFQCVVWGSHRETETTNAIGGHF